MSVREYIGARYIPLFMGDWDNTVTYEPLSVVMYQGASYTSRQFVPTGIDITNTVFWALSGNYNAQVEAYRQEVSDYVTRIEGCENDIDAIEDEIGAGFDSVNTVAAAISDEATTRANADDALQDQIGAGYSSAYTVKDDIDAEATARANADDALQDQIGTGYSAAYTVADAIAYNTLMDRLYSLQARCNSAGASRWAPVPGKDSLDNANVTIPVNEAFQPVMFWSQGNGFISLTGKFTTAQELSNNDVLFSGLPKPRTNFYINNILEYEDSGEMKTGSCILRSNGDLVWFHEMSEHLPDATEVRFSGAAIPCERFEGEYVLDEITSTDAAGAVAWIYSKQNQFDYSNKLSEKNDPATSGATDCSGLIFAAFNSAGIEQVIPNFAIAQAGLGRIVTHASIGDPLDFTDCQAGDIVCYFRANTDFCHHVAMVMDSNGTVWHQNTSYDNGAQYGPQPQANPTTYLDNELRYVVRYVGMFNI